MDTNPMRLIEAVVGARVGEVVIPVGNCDMETHVKPVGTASAVAVKWGGSDKCSFTPISHTFGPGGLTHNGYTEPMIGSMGVVIPNDPAWCRDYPACTVAVAQLTDSCREPDTRWGSCDGAWTASITREIVFPLPGTLWTWEVVNGDGECNTDYYSNAGLEYARLRCVIEASVSVRA